VSVSNISTLRRRSPPGWPSAPDVICQTRTPAALGASRSPCHRSAVGSPREARRSRSNLELRSAGRSLPKPQVSARGHWLRLAGSAMRAPNAQTRSCAGMRWSVPEMSTNLGTNSTEGEFRRGQRAENNGGQGRD